MGEAPLAEELASLGFDADRLRDIRRSRQEARLPWPHPVPIELRREIGFARYDAALAEARAAGADEAVLLNERGAVADGSYMSLFVKRGPALATPRLADGALDGVLRRAMIAGGAPPVVEATLTLDDLRDAEAIYLGNSVRGLRRARLLTAV